MSTSSSGPKKVRLACHRCRVRRIKCDGKIPACTNCAKADQVCLDVDGHNPDIVFPRNFVNAARARIQWLENIIRERLPDVDLLAGPQLGVNLASADAGSGSGSGAGTERQPVSPQAPEDSSISHSQLGPDTISRKRSAESSAQHDHDSLFPERARNIAMNLGMLSLNSDSPQKHYLGSSSGRLFTDLIGASPTDSLGSVQQVEASPSWPTDSSLRTLNETHFLSVIDTLKKELPSKSDAIVLTQTYLRWMHPDSPFLEPQSLFDAIDSIYAFIQDPGDFEVLPNGWPSTFIPFRWNGRVITPSDLASETPSLAVIAFTIFMIFAIGSLVQVRRKVYEFPPQKYYRAALQFSKPAFAQTSLSSIQALILLVVHSTLTPSEVNLWTLVHLGLAFCVEIGIHREATEISPRDFALQQVKRYTFFTVYSLDRSISSIQGRPLGFRDETFDVRLPQPPVSDETASSALSPFIPHSFNTAVHRKANYRFQLDRIFSDIKLHLYHLPSDSTWFPWPENSTGDQKRIEESLERWAVEALEDPFDFACLEPQQREVWRLKLKIRYHTARVLLFQPSQVIQKPPPTSMQACFDSSAIIISSYHSLHDLQSLHMSWISVQNIFAAGATLIYSFWTSSVVRASASVPSVSASLRTCSNLLAIGSEWWPSARNGQRSFNSVADLTMRKLYENEGESSFKAPRLSISSYANDSVLNRQFEMGENIGQQTQGSNKEQDYSTIPTFDRMSTSDTWHPADHASDPAQPVILGDDAGQHPPVFDQEIENFFAEFDSSEFCWSFPLNDSSNTYTYADLPGF